MDIEITVDGKKGYYRGRTADGMVLVRFAKDAHLSYGTSPPMPLLTRVPWYEVNGTDLLEHRCMKARRLAA